MKMLRRASISWWYASLLLISHLIVLRPALALYVVGKPAFQSSSYSDSTGAYKAVNGVDNSCTMTGKEVHPWLRVDLEGEYCIESITVVNRKDCCSARLVGATVRAGTSWDVAENSVCGTAVTESQAETRGGWIKMVCDPPVLARYVSVDIDLRESGRSQYLTVCEMTVTESSSPECPVSRVNTSSFIDVTCYTPTPLVRPTQDDDVFIGAYLGGRDSTDAVSFDRISDTGQPNHPSLPAGSFQVDHPSQAVDASLFYMPSSGGLDRLGAFSCAARKGSVTTNISIILLLKGNDIHVRPVTLTKTVSLGEPVTLEMRAVSPPSTNYRWRHNGGSFIVRSHGHLSHYILNVCTSDSGIYECHVNHFRPQLKHGIMKLIVRACRSGRWDPENSCTKECPSCYNGGICHDRSGLCICAPGFRGHFCEEVLGRAIFGQDGSHHCLGWGDPHSDGCQGKLFCLPDPYGCSCAAGYKGLDCMEECDEETYGADCKQTCHCALNVTCLTDTGECQGECETSYAGVNCQHTACPVGFFGVNCTKLCHCATSSTCHHDSGQCQGPCAETYFGDNCQQQAFIGVQDLTARPDQTNSEQVVLTWGRDSASFYIIEYALINRGHCEPITSPLRVTVPGRLAGGSTEFTVTGLEAASSYRLYVQSQYGIHGLLAKESFTQVWTSPVENPSLVSGLKSLVDAPDVISLSWHPVQCASVYFLTFDLVQRGNCDELTSPQVVRTASTNDTSVWLARFEPLSRYSISITASVDGVNGTESTIQIMTSSAAPEHPSGLSLASVTSNTLKFTWNDLPCEDVHGHFESYRHTLRDASTRDIISSGTTEVAEVGFSELSPCRNYEFNVASLASGFQSSFSHWLVSQTASVEPGPVVASTVVESSATEISLSWQPPRMNSCAVTEYMISFVRTISDSCSTGPVQLPTAITVSADATSITLTGLLPNSQYQIFINAVNSAGPGQEVSLLWSTGAAAPTNPPEDVMVLATDTDQTLGFSWSRPVCVGAISQYTYKLEATPGAGQETLVSSGNTSREWVVINGLAPNQVYSFRVAAYTRAGAGPYTASTLAATRQYQSQVQGNMQSTTTSPGPFSSARWPITNHAKLIGGAPVQPSSTSTIAVVVFVCIIVLVAVVLAFVKLRNVPCRRRPLFSGHVRWTGSEEESTAEANVSGSD